MPLYRYSATYCVENVGSLFCVCVNYLFTSESTQICHKILQKNYFHDLQFLCSEQLAYNFSSPPLLTCDNNMGKISIWKKLQLL
jgi:hypothetical protein